MNDVKLVEMAVRESELKNLVAFTEKLKENSLNEELAQVLGISDLSVLYSYIFDLKNIVNFIKEYRK